MADSSEAGAQFFLQSKSRMIGGNDELQSSTPSELASSF